MPNNFIGIYANQHFGWRKRTSTKDNGTAIYDPARPAEPKDTTGHVEQKRRLVTNEKGEKILSEGFILTAEKINPGDIVVWDGREWPVIARKIICGLMGGELHREVFF